MSCVLLTGDETDVFVRFKFSGDVMSLVIPVFMGLILYRESNKELRILLDLKYIRIHLVYISAWAT